MKIYKTVIDLILIFILFIPAIDTLCSFPSEIYDVWYSAHKGALTFNSTHVTGYPIYMSVAVQSLDFQCEENSGDYYLLKATETAFIFGNDIRAYLCIELHRISEHKYYYFMGTTVDPTNNDNVKGVVDGMTVTMASACNRATPYDAGTYIVLVSYAAPAAGLAEATCSNPLLAKYSSVTITSAAGATCSGTTLDGCTERTGQDYNYDASCSMQFSTSGSFICMKSVYSGGKYYLSTWNNDSMIANGDYQFTCLVVTLSGATAYATEVPNYCADTTQTSTALPSGATEGNIYVYGSQTESCVITVEGQSNAVFYATIVIGSLALIALIVLIVFLLKTKGCPKCCREPCSCCPKCCREPCSCCPKWCCPPCPCIKWSALFSCCQCKACKRTNKVSDRADRDPESYMQEEAKADEVANIIFRLPPMDAFKPKRPIPIGPVVEANIMPLPKVEPLYAKLPDKKLKRTTSIGSIFSFKMKF